MPGSKTFRFQYKVQLNLLPAAVAPADKLLRLTGLNADIQQPQELFDELLDSVRGVDELLQAVGRLVKQSALSE